MSVPGNKPLHCEVVEDNILLLCGVVVGIFRGTNNSADLVCRLHISWPKDHRLIDLRSIYPNGAGNRELGTEMGGYSRALP